MPQTLFVYGTLTFPEIVEALTGKKFVSEQASLPGYSVRQIIDKPYPGMVADKNDIAIGQLLYDVDQKSLDIINEWEDVGYKRVQVIANCVSGTQQAITYVWDHSASKEKWDKDHFRKQYLDEYISNYIPEFNASLSN